MRVMNCSGRTSCGTLSRSTFTVESSSDQLTRRIRAVLDARGRSPERLAEVTGIAARKIDRRLHPTSPAGLNVAELNAIAIALDIHPAELLRD